MEKNINIFVTGASGFVGSYLVRYLIKEGFTNITALKRENSNLDLLGSDISSINWINGDIRDVSLVYEILEGQQWVFHCAGSVSFDPKERKSMFEINVEGTENIVNACIENQCEHLIYMSSVSALGKLKNGNPTDENVPWEKTKNTSFYSISKYRAEMTVRRGMAEGLNVSIINPSIILGAGQWYNRSSSALLSLVKKGLPQFPPGRSGFVDVRDVAKFLIEMAKGKHYGESYLLNSENLPFSTLFTMIAERIGAKIPIRTFPIWLVRIIAALEKARSGLTGKAPLISRETINSAFGSMSYSNNKSLEVEGFTYRSIETCIAESCALFNKSKKEGSSYATFDLQ